MNCTDTNILEELGPNAEHWLLLILLILSQRGIPDSYAKQVLEKIGKSYLITPMNLETVDDPSYNTIGVRKSVDITPVTKCIDCKFLKTETYMEEAGVWRRECRCEKDHRPSGIDSFFCADGRPKEKDKED